MTEFRDTHERAVREFLQEHDRVAIVGGPGAGKTTLSELVTDRPVFHTDDMILKLSWEEQPAYWLARLAGLPRWCLEGIHTARFLRKAYNWELPPPVNGVIALRGTYKVLEPAQARAALAVWTVFDYWAARTDIPWIGLHANL